MAWQKFGFGHGGSGGVGTESKTDHCKCRRTNSCAPAATCAGQHAVEAGEVGEDALEDERTVPEVPKRALPDCRTRGSC